jgi:hypothetical protein
MHKLLQFLKFKLNLVYHQESLFYKYFALVNKNGFFRANKKVILFIINRFKIKTAHEIMEEQKIKISKKLDIIFNSTVQYGPFKGLKFCNNTVWGISDRASMLLGLYEKEVLESLKNIPKKYSSFINIGAADGYYGVGVLVNNLFEKSICYETSIEENVIGTNAKLNNVMHRIEIQGTAKKDFFKELPENVLSNAVLLVDIEGAEFEIIDKKTFEAFKKSIIFVELHDWFYEDGLEKLQKMKNDSISTHLITTLTTGARDLSIFSELKKMHDHDRWLICSERRQQQMNWLRFDPK